MDNLDSCRECGAYIDNLSKHRQWHADLKKVKDSADYAETIALDLEGRVESLED